MTSAADHEHPQYVTRADLEACERRIINAMAEMELRLERSISTAFWRQVLTLLGVGLVVAVLMINVGISILGKLA